MSGMVSKKELLLERFDLARRQNADLISEISEYAELHQAFDTPFTKGYTFASGIKVLQEERDLVFNNTNRQAILDADDTASELDFLIQKIEAQIVHYGEIKMGLNVFFKSIN